MYLLQFVKDAANSLGNRGAFGSLRKIDFNHNQM